MKAMHYLALVLPTAQVDSRIERPQELRHPSAHPQVQLYLSALPAPQRPMEMQVTGAHPDQSDPGGKQDCHPKGGNRVLTFGSVSFRQLPSVSVRFRQIPSKHDFPQKSSFRCNVQPKLQPPAFGPPLIIPFV